MAACDLEPRNCDVPLLRQRVVQANSGKLSAQGTAICLTVALDEVERLRKESEELRTLAERHKSNYEWWRKHYYESLDASMELITGNAELRNENERLRTENADLRRRLVGAEEAGKVVAAARGMVADIEAWIQPQNIRALCDALETYDRAVTAGQAGEVEGEG